MAVFEAGKKAVTQLNRVNLNMDHLAGKDCGLIMPGIDRSVLWNSTRQQNPFSFITGTA